MITKIVKPNKEEIRSWLRQRQAGRQPLPDCEQIRNQLGWKLARNKQS